MWFGFGARPSLPALRGAPGAPGTRCSSRGPGSLPGRWQQKPEPAPGACCCRGLLGQRRERCVPCADSCRRVGTDVPSQCQVLTASAGIRGRSLLSSLRRKTEELCADGKRVWGARRTPLSEQTHMRGGGARFHALLSVRGTWQRAHKAGVTPGMSHLHGADEPQCCGGLWGARGCSLQLPPSPVGSHLVPVRVSRVWHSSWALSSHEVTVFNDRVAGDI